MKKILLASVAMLFMIACKKDPIAKGTPDCIVSSINQFEAVACDNSAHVKKYQFQNQFVFVFDQGTCGADFTSAVLTENCDTLGLLGGLMGNDTINNQSFSNHAQYLSTVWSN